MVLTQELLERLHTRLLCGGAAGKQRGVALYGVVHSGFVEPVQREPAVRTLELFARAVGLRWQGAASFGGTSPIDGRPLEEVGRLAAVVREGLALMAQDITAGQALSSRTCTIMPGRALSFGSTP